MANIVNNVDLEKVSQTAEKGKEDKSSLKKPIKLTGEWILDPNQGFQFITELGFEKGKEVIEIDSPSFLDGQGNRLGPMAYCVAGITSCFTVGRSSDDGRGFSRCCAARGKVAPVADFAKTFDV